jgi:uncharacterized membrane protein
MKFAMNRDSGLVTFKGLEPNTIVKVYWPDGKEKLVEALKSGEVTIDFSKARKQFLRKEVKIEIYHKDFETVIFMAEIRATKLIQKPVSSQVKKG